MDEWYAGLLDYGVGYVHDVYSCELGIGEVRSSAGPETVPIGRTGVLLVCVVGRRSFCAAQSPISSKFEPELPTSFPAMWLK